MISKTITAVCSTLFAIAILSSSALFSSAQAGSRYYNEGPGFFLFDLFAQAPGSKYRRGSPKVYGFSKKVGGYSYNRADVYSFDPGTYRGYNPIEDREFFSPRLGESGPYLGN